MSRLFGHLDEVCAYRQAGAPGLSLPAARAGQGAGNPSDQCRWTRPWLPLRLRSTCVDSDRFPAPAARGTRLRLPTATDGLGATYNSTTGCALSIIRGRTHPGLHTSRFGRERVQRARVKPLAPVSCGTGPKQVAAMTRP